MVGEVVCRGGIGAVAAAVGICRERVGLVRPERRTDPNRRCQQAEGRHTQVRRHGANRCAPGRGGVGEDERHEREEEMTIQEERRQVEREVKG